MTAPDYLFPDNTVLINFAIIGELPLLGGLLGSKGAWVAAVEAECEASARTGRYPAGLAGAASIITHTLYPTTAENIDARAIRNQIAKPGEPFPKSYGEAQTMAIITKRGLSSVFITDDGGVGDYVRGNTLPVTVISTTDVLALAVRTGRMTQTLAEQHIATLVAAGRKRISLKRFRASLSPKF